MAGNLANNDFKNYRSVLEADHFEGQQSSPTILATASQTEIGPSWVIGGVEANRFYNQFISLLLTGSFNREAMLRALRDLVNMHMVLKTTFNADGENIVYSELALDINYQDLSSQLPDQQRLFIKRHQKLTILKSFDLEKGPLFKVSLFNLNNEEHYLTFVAHPIICDERSIGIMMKDLVKLYSNYAPSRIKQNAFVL
jgi:hypothetical protein